MKQKGKAPGSHRGSGGHESSDSSPSKPKKRSLKDVNAPKIPMNPYTFFMNEHKHEFKNQPNSREIISKLAGKWRGMTDEEKQVYVNKTAGGMSKYREELKTYKNSESYKKFLKEKEKHDKQSAKQGSFANKAGQAGSSKEKPSGMSVNGIPVFSQAFLEHNKSKEAHLRKLQREISELEDETGLIQKNIVSLSGKLEVMQESLYNDELGLTNLEKTTEKWRKLTMKAMEDAKILGHFHLTPSSTAEELTNKLEEASKKGDNPINISLRQCLSSVSYA